MLTNLEKSWKKQLSKELIKPYYAELLMKLKKEYVQYCCYPEKEKVFAAFNQCPFDQVKVVIVGQDPYHGPNQANGLCFSVNDGLKHPPSLVNIFKELGKDVGKEYPNSGNLEGWAKQGVLLLNATLSVRAEQAASHQKMGWETFTNAVISELSHSKTELVFLLWGAFAKKKISLIDTDSHNVLSAGHPSPLSANRGYWFGNKHFSTTNKLLSKINKKPIIW